MKEEIQDKPASMNNIAFDTGVITERERILKQVQFEYAMYAGFYPEIGNALLNIIEFISPEHHDKMLEIIESIKK